MSKKKLSKIRHVRRILLHPIENLLVKGLCLFINLLPPKVSVAFGGFIGAMAFSLFGVRKKVCLINLKIAFPDKSVAELKKIGRNSYANTGRTMMEILLLGKMDKNYFETHVTVEGEKVLDAALENGKGALGVTGHFGSWEVMAAAIKQRDYPVDLLIGHQKNKQVDALFNALREKQNLGLIPLHTALKGVWRSLKKNRMVAMLSDQDPRRGASVEVDFFGKKTNVYTGAALFSLKAKSPLLCPFIVRLKKGLDHRIVINPPIQYEPCGDKEKDIQALTQKHTTCLEQWITKHPDHWFWGHKRWKSSGVKY